MEFDNLAQVKALAQLPPAPVKPVSDRSAWGAPWRALKAGTADVLGSVADVVKGYGAAGAIAAEADPVARAALGDQAIESGAAEGRRQFAADEATVSDAGASFRNVSESLRPDPATASTAEKLVFGVVRPLAKIAGAAVTAGPIGVGFASAEEGFTQAEDLRRQGVDTATRTAVGTLAATATAASAFLPMAGPTLKSTAALYLAGGPGGFIAQQAATRAILEHADYDQIAAQYDPLDPMGLAVSSLIPLPFAAHGAFKASRMAPAAVDAAMTHNLSIAQDAAEHRLFTEPVPEPATVTEPALKPELAPAKGGEQAAAPTAEEPDLAAVRQRVAAIEEAQPAVAAEMEQVRKQIAEGSDNELGTLDADLLKVAAECALSMGAA
jgi:hypothetical protein